jgi:hypothetical protein
VDHSLMQLLSRSSFHQCPREVMITNSIIVMFCLWYGEFVGLVLAVFLWFLVWFCFARLFSVLLVFVGLYVEAVAYVETIFHWLGSSTFNAFTFDALASDIVCRSIQDCALVSCLVYLVGFSPQFLVSIAYMILKMVIWF